MEMIKAVIRPEKEEAVIAALEEKGFISLTKMDVFGRGKQKGLTVGGTHYEELPKVMIMLVVSKDETSIAIETIREAALTGGVGDGKIFVSPVEAAYTVRTGQAEL
jgi:nitrogen regulatory protein PII 1